MVSPDSVLLGVDRLLHAMQEARTSLARVNNVSLNQLSHSLVKLDRWVVSTVMQCCDANARPMDKVDVKLAPICLLCSEISYVGAGKQMARAGTKRGSTHEGKQGDAHGLGGVCAWSCGAQRAATSSARRCG